LAALGFELRASCLLTKQSYCLSHSVRPCVGILRKGLMNYLPRLALNHIPADLCILVS
jgi:hypothetical protein